MHRRSLNGKMGLRILLCIFAAVMLMAGCAPAHPTQTVPVNTTKPVTNHPTTRPTTAPTTVPTTTPTTAPTEPAAPAVPTQAEMRMLEQFDYIVEFLDQYVPGTADRVTFLDEDGLPTKSLRGQLALLSCYEWLAEHPQVDAWVEYCKDQWGAQFNWDREVLLSKFTKLANVPIRDDKTDYDADTPEDRRYPFTLSTYNYNELGQLTGRTDIDETWQLYIQDPLHKSLADAQYTYDAAGRVAQMRFENYPGCTYFFVYDDAGRLVSQTVQDAGLQGQITYTYDALGRLVQVDAPEYVGAPGKWQIRYFYDELGYMIREEKSLLRNMTWQSDALYVDLCYIMEYTYDENQEIVSAVQIQQDWDYGAMFDPNTQTYVDCHHLELETRNTYAFTFAAGKLMTIRITYGDTYHMSGTEAGTVASEPMYDHRLIEVIYGNYYFYNN